MLGAWDTIHANPLYNATLRLGGQCANCGDCAAGSPFVLEADCGADTATLLQLGPAASETGATSRGR